MSEYPSKRDAVRRIADLAADDQTLRGILQAGESDLYWYYLVVVKSEFEGNTYLNERYVQLAKPNDEGRDDTFKKNGINRRVHTPEETAEKLSRLYSNVSNDDPDNFIV